MGILQEVPAKLREKKKKTFKRSKYAYSNTPNVSASKHLYLLSVGSAYAPVKRGFISEPIKKKASIIHKLCKILSCTKVHLVLSTLTNNSVHRVSQIIFILKLYFCLSFTLHKCKQMRKVLSYRLNNNFNYFSKL